MHSWKRMKMASSSFICKWSVVYSYTIQFDHIDANLNTLGYLNGNEHGVSVILWFFIKTMRNCQD